MMMMAMFMLLGMGAMIAVIVALVMVTTGVAMNSLPAKRKREAYIPEKLKRGSSYVLMDDGEIMEVVDRNLATLHSYD